MGVYRAHDLWRVPGLLSLARVPLAVAFPFFVARPFWALGVLLAAGISDVVDGWYARRFQQVTPTGAAIDPVTDKLFVLTVAITLAIGGRLSATDVLLLGARDLAELPLVVWVAASSHARRIRAARGSANVPGKVGTLLQFAAVCGALFRVAHLHWLIVATALAGLFAAATYWHRTLRNADIDARVV